MSHPPVKPTFSLVHDILLIDDQELPHILLRRMLKGEPDLNLLSCKNPTEATMMIKDVKPSTILLDIIMPELDGLTLLRHIRSAKDIDSNLSIIMLSTEDKAETKAEAFRNGANDFLVKLPEKVEMLARIRYHATAFINIIYKREAEESLKRAHKDLELRVEKRTRDLHLANLRMQEEIRERKQVEEALRTAQEELEKLAYYDALTNLPNRTMFQDRMEHEIQFANRNDRLMAVFFIDLDRFKHVNDSMGHAAGDQLLQEVASRLTACVRKSDTVARLGGDEFTVILADVDKEENVAHVAMKIIDSISEAIPLQGSDVFIGASIGIGLFPMDGKDFDTLTKNADTAMYKAKEAGRGNYKFYKEEMNSWAAHHLTLEGNLRKAVEEEQFLVHYQPQVDLGDNSIIGVEALVRWQHPKYGIVGPTEFISLAEESGLIVPLGKWVLYEACRQANEWHRMGLPRVSVGVNLSARQFRQGDLLETVGNILDRTGLEPEWLNLELTESVVMQDTRVALETLRSLIDMGIKISIDDFGTGFSSLSYLKTFPFSMLKIDRSFILDIPDDADNEAITIAIISMAKSLNIQVMAEGVETQAQREFLNRHGCRIGQGFLYGKPVSAEKTEKILRDSAEG